MSTRRTITLAKIIALTVVGLHAVLVPALYFGIARNVRSIHADAFKNHARTYSHILAEELESNLLSTDNKALQNFLDGLALGGEVVYAEFDRDGKVFKSDLLLTPPDVSHAGEDFSFGEGEDRIYHLSVSVVSGGQPATLRVGFDETPVLESIASTLHSVLVSLVVYSIAVLVTAWIFSRRIARPLRNLQSASGRIARGNDQASLQTDSAIREIVDLTADLETMRSALVGAKERLAEQMQERELLEGRLRQKQRLETVGTLAGGIAHEMNNVLVPITLFAEIALDKLPPDHPAHHDLQRILSSARRARTVSGNVLTFSRAGGSPTLVPTDLNHAVQEALTLFDALKPADVQLIRHLDGECRRVLGDETLIIQVAMNLCTNSLQAMPDGGEITVSSSNIMVTADDKLGVTPGPYVELCVTDTGLGMDAAMQERMYEPFYTNRVVGEGTGLGLSVVYGIVSSLKGVINVKSQLGFGTSFHILFPAEDKAASNTGESDEIHLAN